MASLSNKISQKIQSAMKHHQEGRLQQAKDIYLEVLKSEPDNAEANHRLGLIAQQLKKYDDAVQLISRAIDKDSTKAIYFNNLGAAQRGQGKTDEAIASFNKALSLKPPLQTLPSMGGLKS